MKRRIRVVQLICGFLVGDFGGGAELFGIRIAEALDPALFEVAICNLWFYDTPVERSWHRYLRERGITILYGAPYSGHIRPDTFKAYLRCVPQLRAFHPDIVNTHVEYADLIGVAAKLSGVSGYLVRTGHSSHEWSNKPRMRRFTHALYPFVCATELGVAQAVVDQLNQRPAARLAGKRATYIPNGVDTDVVLRQRSGKDIRAMLGIPPHVPLFGTVGRLMEQKGMAYLIRAMRDVCAALPEARLLIVGKGHLEAELRALVKELDLEDRIMLLGGRSDAVDLIAGFDVFVLSSLWEGLPTVILEAMVVGTPVVATNISGSRDLVIPGRTGLLVPPRDPQALAAGMIEHYCERERAQAMAAAARIHAEQFSIRRAAGQYADLYLRLISGGS